MYTFLLFFHCFPILPGNFGRKKFPLTQYHGNLRQGDILYQKIFIFRFPYANMQPSLGLSARPGPSHSKRQAPFLPWIRSVLPPACTTLRPPPSSARRRLHRHRLFLSRTAPVHSPAPPPTGTTAPLPRQIVLCPFPSGTSRQDCTALCNLPSPPPSLQNIHRRPAAQKTCKNSKYHLHTHIMLSSIRPSVTHASLCLSFAHATPASVYPSHMLRQPPYILHIYHAVFPPVMSFLPRFICRLSGIQAQTHF